MIVKLSMLMPPEARQALAEAGYEIVKVGEAPRWMERIWSMPAEVYRMKRLED